ncbi:MAG: C25 family peptidase propeptide domain-containing protein [Anaerolineae bacterium]
MVLALLIGGLAAAQGAGPEPGTSIVLRVATPDYTLDEHGLRMPGYGVHDVPGAPALLVWSTVVELTGEGAWSVSYASRNVQMRRVPAPLPAVPAPWVAFDRPLSTEEIAAQVLAAPRVEQPDPVIYSMDAFYPSAPVQAGPEQWQRGRRLLAVRVFPFQYNPATGQVRYHPEVEVRVTTETVTTKDAPSLGGEEVTTEVVTTKGALSLGSDDFSRPALRIYTGPRGLYRLTYADLAAAGVPVDTLDPATLAMTYLDEPIAVEVTGEEDGRFDPDDLVIFYAEPYTGRYMTRNVYRLTWGDGPGTRMAPQAPLPGVNSR